MKNYIIALMLSVMPICAMADDLRVDNATLTLDQTFTKLPTFRYGGIPEVVKPVAKPLNDKSFSWAAGYIWQDAIVGHNSSWPPASSNYPAWTSDGNADASPNGDEISHFGVNNSPFVFDGTSFNISAVKMPSWLAPQVPTKDAGDYLSGSMTSFPYAQQYGVFVMVAKIPKGKGTWPAFWLLPADESWPPELDVMEVIGQDTTTLVTTVHYKDAKGAAQAQAVSTKSVDLSLDYHEYAVDWSPTIINWYLDKKLVHTTATPAGMNKPFYILANLAIGKPANWGGAPDVLTVFPATMRIKSIKAYQRPEYVGK